MESDLDAGVRQSLGNLVSGTGIAIWECDLHSPAEDPEHCPPGVVWLLHLHDQRIARIRLFHPVPPRVARSSDLADEDEGARYERAALG